MTKLYIVWNEAKTEGYVTRDKQIAYEVRKGSDGNLYFPDGTPARLAIPFVDWTADENCTIEEIEQP